jgi:5-formyltetrahydrofolate cyclo-ligase
VAAYLAVKAEIDPASFVDTAGQRGVAIAYPRITTGSPRLRFFQIAGPQNLRTGRYGIPEPDSSCAEVPLADIGVFVVPGLAFHAQGQRLGSGGGYYDEIIARARSAGTMTRSAGAVFVGFAFDFQLVDHCPAADQDQPIDCLVTDTRVVYCKG